MKQKIVSLNKIRIPLNMVLLLVVMIFFLTIFVGFAVFTRIYYEAENDVFNVSPRPVDEPILLEDSGLDDIVVLLYTMDGFWLEKEQLKVSLSTESHRKIQEIIGLFFRGPYNRRFQHFYSSEIEVKSIFIQEGILIVNLSEHFTDTFKGVSLNTTLVQTYSLINTLLINNPQVQGVQILVEGISQETLNEWIDLSVPLIFNQSIIK